MKKLFTLVLAVLMLCSVSVTAFAADLDKNHSTDEITVSHNVEQSFVKDKAQ